MQVLCIQNIQNNIHLVCLKNPIVVVKFECYDGGGCTRKPKITISRVIEARKSKPGARARNAYASRTP